MAEKKDGASGESRRSRRKQDHARANAGPRLSAELLWGLAGAAAGFRWFWLSYALPGSLTGRTFGDTPGYIQFASAVSSWSQFFTSYNLFSAWGTDRTIGYPLFLYIHRWISETLGLGPKFDWVNLSLITAFGLHCFASVFLFRSVRKAKIALHPIALALLLASPLLNSAAAVALSDSVAGSYLMLGMCGILRYQSAEKGKSWGWAVGAGAGFGMAVLCRPSLQPASLFVLFAWAVLGFIGSERFKLKGARARQRQSAVAALTPALAILGYFAALFPQYMSCTLRFGQVCQIRPGYVDAAIAETIRYGLGSARCECVHGSINPPVQGPYCVPDPFMQSQFKDRCVINDLTAKADVISCFVSNIGTLPVFMTKKVIGLFGQTHLSDYATFVTSPTERAWARAFGAMGFVGFICSLILLGRGILRRENDPRLLLLAFTFVYAGMSTVPHVETRYGIPATPVSLFAFVFVVQEILRWRSRRTWVAASIMAGIGLVFLMQTAAWDRLDAMTYEDLQHYLERSGQ